MDISIVTVNFNGERFIQDYYSSIENLDLKGIELECIFVDNNSKDNSLLLFEKLKNESKSGIVWRLLDLKKNTGFAGGNNIGAGQAQGKYLVFLNNDTKVQKDWLKELFKGYERNIGAGIVCSKLVFYPRFVELILKSSNQNDLRINKTYKLNGLIFNCDAKYNPGFIYDDQFVVLPSNTPLRIQIIENSNLDLYFEFDKVWNGEIEISGIKFVVIDSKAISCTVETGSLKSFDLIQNAGSKILPGIYGSDIGSGERDIGQFNLETEVEMACGAAMMIGRMDFLKLNGFDEKFFMYYEDSDLSLRMKRQLKKKIIYIPTAVVRHIHTGSSKEWSPFFVYYVFRNRIFFIAKNFNLSALSFFCLKEIKSLIKELLSHQNREIKIARTKALLVALFFSPFLFLGRKIKE